MHVDVADPEFAARLEVPVGPRVVQAPAARVAVPLGGVELHALEVEAPRVVAQLVQSGLPRCGGVEVVVVGQLVGGVGLGQLRRLVGLPEPPLVVELAELGGLEDRVVDVSVLEEVLHQPLTALVEVVLVAPHLGLGREIAVIVVEAVDELLAVDVALVLRSGVPQGNVGVDDEVAVAVLAIHEVSLGSWRCEAVTPNDRSLSSVLRPAETIGVSI